METLAVLFLATIFLSPFWIGAILVVKWWKAPSSETEPAPRYNKHGRRLTPYEEIMQDTGHPAPGKNGYGKLG